MKGMKDTSSKTSWGNVAGWYDELLEQSAGAGHDTYQSALILPNLIRVLAPRSGETILDIACGQGFFSREIAKAAAAHDAKHDFKVVACDIAKELIDLATASKESKNA